MKFPRIHLAIDNCFASKRWTTPAQWLRLAADLGVYCVEASADNECDPLYMDRAYLSDWCAEVRRSEKETGVKVVNLYSGHGTYATLGLAHHDERIRNRMQHDWLETMTGLAGDLGAGLGFFCHAFTQSLLQCPEQYRNACDDLYRRLAELASAASANCRNMAVEQMYTPHQIPWTIQGAKHLMREVFARSGKPFYITIDTGHQSGQRKFLKPTSGAIEEALGRYAERGRIENFWIGPRSAHLMFKRLARSPEKITPPAVRAIQAELERYPYLFADDEDGDPYEWLAQVGCYSPIIHLQQTPGDRSAHLPFNQEHNADGIIKAPQVLQALAKAYETATSDDLPPACEEIYLTLEIFAGTADLPLDIYYKLKDSVDYWRRFIPEDGATLEQLL